MAGAAKENMSHAKRGLDSSHSLANPAILSSGRQSARQPLESKEVKKRVQMVADTLQLPNDQQKSPRNKKSTKTDDIS